MPDEIYEVVAQGARYWFLFLMALIVWRSYRWFSRDRKQRRKRLKLLPDAGFVGEMVVQAGNAELPPGLALPVAREGVLGSVRGADIYAPIGGVAKKHLWFEYDAENGLYVEPYGGNSADVDGQPLLGWRTHAYMAHGSRLTVGGAVLRLRMFAGFEQAGMKGAAGLAFKEDAADADADARQLAAMQAQWAAWQAAQAAASGVALPQPAAATAPDAQQLAAMQAQWAAWQAAQAAASGIALPQPAAAATAPDAQQLAAMQAQWAAWQAAQAAASGIALPQPAAATAPDTQQLAAMQAQWAAWQAAQAAAQNAAQARSAMAAAPQPAPRVLDMPEGAFMAPPRVTPPKPILTGTDAGQEDAREPDEAVQAQPLRHYRASALPPLDDTVPQRDGGRPTPEASQPDTPAMPGSSFAPATVLYPPVTDDGADGVPDVNDAPPDGAGDPMADSWPYAAFPQSDVRFVPGGYTYPEVVEPDVPYEYADEDEAPRSLYVEADEAEKVKRLLWDRYLKGGGR